MIERRVDRFGAISRAVRDERGQLVISGTVVRGDGQQAARVSAPPRTHARVRSRSPSASPIRARAEASAACGSVRPVPQARSVGLGHLPALYLPGLSDALCHHVANHWGRLGQELDWRRRNLQL